MRYGIEVIPFGEYADPRRVVELAVAAEAAGWEALFIWDHMGFVYDFPSGDPWITLAAVAQATDRLRLITHVAALPRYTPPLLARLVSALDLLSNGRLTLGVGLGGVDQEFSAFGENGDLAVRAAQADEMLDVLGKLWRGRPVSHEGTHYRVDNVTLAPLPVQQLHPPVWVGGESRPALRRAAHWNGWAMGVSDEQGNLIKTPKWLAARLTYIHKHRPAARHDEPFDVALTGVSPANDPGMLAAFAAAGATWWGESIHGYRGSFAEMMDRVEAGPPRS